MHSQPCVGNAINANTCNLATPISSTTMLFTSCQNQLAKISNISTNNATFNTPIIIQGKVKNNF